MQYLSSIKTMLSSGKPLSSDGEIHLFILAALESIHDSLLMQQQPQSALSKEMVSMFLTRLKKANTEQKFQSIHSFLALWSMNALLDSLSGFLFSDNELLFSDLNGFLFSNPESPFSLTPAIKKSFDISIQQKHSINGLVMSLINNFRCAAISLTVEHNNSLASKAFVQAYVSKSTSTPDDAMDDSAEVAESVVYSTEQQAEINRLEKFVDEQQKAREYKAELDYFMSDMRCFYDEHDDERHDNELLVSRLRENPNFLGFYSADIAPIVELALEQHPHMHIVIETIKSYPDSTMEGLTFTDQVGLVLTRSTSENDIKEFWKTFSSLTPNNIQYAGFNFGEEDNDAPHACYGEPTEEELRQAYLSDQSL